MALALAGLEGGTVGVCRAIGLSGPYRNSTSIAAVVLGVVYAIFHVTLNALDILRGIAFTFIIKLLVFHFIILLSSARCGRVIIIQMEEFIHRDSGRERIIGCHFIP